MKRKIKKNLRLAITIIAVLWIFAETISNWTDWEEIFGVLVMWGIAMYSLEKF